MLSFLEKLRKTKKNLRSVDVEVEMRTDSIPNTLPKAETLTSDSNSQSPKSKENKTYVLRPRTFW